MSLQSDSKEQSSVWKFKVSPQPKILQMLASGKVMLIFLKFKGIILAGYLRSNL
jgi:hypothetical protein